MITSELFSMGFVVLEERFSKSFSESVRAMYYEILSENLDGWQFEAAVREVFRREDYFPSPQKIIDLAPTLERLIGAEMARLGLNAVLPDTWQSEGCVLVGQLPPGKAQEYLLYLRDLSPTDLQLSGISDATI